MLEIGSVFADTGQPEELYFWQTDCGLVFHVFDFVSSLTNIYGFRSLVLSVECLEFISGFI